MVDSLFAVVRRDPGESSLRLLDGLFVTSTAEAVDRVIEQTPNDARYFAGFVGWKPGELAREIAAGYWYVGDADPALVFSHDTDAMWEKLVERFGNGHAPQKRMIRAGLQPGGGGGLGEDVAVIRRLVEHRFRERAQRHDARPGHGVGQLREPWGRGRWRDGTSAYCA
jgi:hypothetical protein